jgi:hypothetical protein
MQEGHARGACKRGIQEGYSYQISQVFPWKYFPDITRIFHGKIYLWITCGYVDNFCGYVDNFCG